MTSEKNNLAPLRMSFVTAAFALLNRNPLFTLLIMSKAPIVTFLIFVLGGLAGCVLLVLLAMLLGAITLATYRHTHPGAGLGAVAGGLCEASVMLVPLLSGTIAVLLGQGNRRSR